jgi:hypothetical protein
MTAEGGERPTLRTTSGHVFEVASGEVGGGAADGAPRLVDDLLPAALLLGVGAALWALGVLGLLALPLVVDAAGAGGEGGAAGFDAGPQRQYLTTLSAGY